MLAQTTRILVYSASAFAVMAAVSIAAPARAADSDTQSTAIQYHDLDLNTAAGEARLKLRIAKAAAAVCGATDARVSIEEYERFTACRDYAIASASPQMNAVIASARSSDHRYAMTNGAIAMLGR